MSAIAPAAILDELLPAFRENDESRSFALLDAARDERIYPAILRADCEWACLYRGDAAATMAEVAPYLLQLDRRSELTAWVVENGWGNSWGIYLTAAAPLDVLRNHFRRFLMVELPDGRTVYFRFYDPRVLRVYVPTCTVAERDLFFGPVDQYLSEDEHGNVTRFVRARVSPEVR